MGRAVTAVVPALVPGAAVTVGVGSTVAGAGPGSVTGTAWATALAVVAVVAVAALLVLVRRGRATSAAADHARRRAGDLATRLEALGALTDTGALIQSADGRVVEVDQRAAAVLGLDASAAVGRPVADLPVTLVDASGARVHPGAVLGSVGGPGGPGAPGGPDGPNASRGPGGSPESRGSRGAVVVGVTAPDGSAAVRRVRVQSRPLAGGDGRAGSVLTALTPVGATGGDRSGVALHDAAQGAPVALALADVDGRVLEANRAFAAFVGAGLEARPAVDLSDPARGSAGTGATGAGGPGGGAAASEPWARAVARLVSGEPRVTVEQRWSHAGDAAVAVVLDLALVPGTGQEPPRVAVVARDVTGDRLRSDALTHRALHDPLTGLANRALLLGTLQELLEQPGAAERVAVLACDLDGFKPINDRFGHAAGDEVLVHVAGVLRAAAGGHGTVARLGGDEFVVVLASADSARTAQEVAGGIHAGLREPVRLQRHRIEVRASVGVALGSSAAPTTGAPGLLAAADAALYRAKGGGRSRTEVYDPAVDHDGAPAALTAELPGALERGELVVHLQPVVELADGRVAGERALLRWAHPERGLLPASAFGHAVREAGLPVAVARHVLAGAVDHLVGAAGRWVGVVLDAEVLGDGELVRSLLADLGRRGVAPGRLVVGLDGAAAGDVVHRVRADLVDLRAAGVPVLLHGFGAGPSALGVLRDLPVDGVTLDPSFTRGVVEDAAAARVVRAVGSLCRELELLTVADGVDTPEQARVLAGAGWRFGVGWAFGGPQPAPTSLRPTQAATWAGVAGP